MAKNSVIYLTQSVGLSVDYEQSLIRLQFVVRDAKEKREKNRVNSWLCGHFFLAVFFRVTHAHVGLSKRATKPFRGPFSFFLEKNYCYSEFIFLLVLQSQKFKCYMLSSHPHSDLYFTTKTNNVVFTFVTSECP